jgi:hypothetical protein
MRYVVLKLSEAKRSRHSESTMALVRVDRGTACQSGIWYRARLVSQQKHASMHTQNPVTGNVR